MKSISTRFDDDTLHKLDEIAETTSSTRSAIITDAVNHYLEYLMWYKGEIQKGLDDFETGRVVDHADVIKKINGLGINVD